MHENRRYLSAVIDVLKFTATHRLAQRGHNESDDSPNSGNFLENTIPLLARSWKHRLAMSKGIQNEILAVMAKMVQENIAYEVKARGEFSLMADETKDCHKMEQLSIVLRYFQNGSVYESFVGFV